MSPGLGGSFSQQSHGRLTVLFIVRNAGFDYHYKYLKFSHAKFRRISVIRYFLINIQHRDSVSVMQCLNGTLSDL